jgi:hypothetical protein
VKNTPSVRLKKALTEGVFFIQNVLLFDFLNEKIFEIENNTML